MRSNLGELEQFLLFALVRLGENAYGVTVRRELEQRTGRSHAAGAIYTALERLEEKGFVSSSFGEPSAERGGKRKKFYRLEPAGARALSRSYGAMRQMARGLIPRLEAIARGRTR